MQALRLTYIIFPARNTYFKRKVLICCLYSVGVKKSNLNNKILYHFCSAINSIGVTISNKSSDISFKLITESKLNIVIELNPLTESSFLNKLKLISRNICVVLYVKFPRNLDKILGRFDYLDVEPREIVNLRKNISCIQRKSMINFNGTNVLLII